MKKMDEPWLNKVKESLRDYEEPVPFGGWDKLEKELSVAPGLSIYKRRRRYMAVAAVFLLLISSAYIISLYLSGITLEEDISSPVVTIVPDPLTPLVEPDVLKEIVPALPEYREQRSNVQQPVALVPDVQKVISEEEVGTFPAEDIPDEVISEKQIIYEEETPDSAAQPVERRSVVRSSRDKLHLPVETKKKRDSRGWAMGLAMANAPGISGAGDNYMEYNKVSLSSMANGIYTVDSDALVVRESNTFYTQKLQDVDYNHRQPITAGISVRKELPRGFSVETGLMYTFLSSDASIDNEYVKKQEQKLHYLGIPLKANWTFWEKSRFSLYVSGGGMVEKSIAGETSYAFTEAGKEMNAGEGTYKSSNLKVKELQWSLSASAGAQFHINRYMGLYVEPGVAYYFDDGSNVETIRKERPFNFNLQVGFRFSY